MPVGNDAVPELLPTPEQREYMYHQIREFRGKKPIFMPWTSRTTASTWAAASPAVGATCTSTPTATCDPCVFIHYSDSNIREKTLLEALQLPLFRAYHDGQPFNDNMLRPCPMLENPEKLREIVHKSSAHPSDVHRPGERRRSVRQVRRLRQELGPHRRQALELLPPLRHLRPAGSCREVIPRRVA